MHAGPFVALPHPLTYHGTGQAGSVPPSSLFLGKELHRLPLSFFERPSLYCPSKLWARLHGAASDGFLCDDDAMDRCLGVWGGQCARQTRNAGLTNYRLSFETGI